MRKIKSPILVIIISLFVMGLIFGFGIWYYIDSQIPELNTKKPVNPVPNAFDCYNNAQKLIKDKEKLSSLYKEVKSNHSSINGNKKAEMYREIQYIVDENTNVLSDFRKGFQYNYQAPPWRSPDQTFYYYPGFRRIVKLLLLDSCNKAADGNYMAATSDCLDSMKIGNDIKPGIGLMSTLVGIACQYDARHFVWNYIDKLNASQSLAVLRRLQKIRTNTWPIYKTMQEEKNNNVILAYQMCGYYPGVLTCKELILMPKWEKRDLISMTHKNMDEAVLKSMLPYPLASKYEEKYTKASIPDAGWGNEIALILYTHLAPAYDKAILRYISNETRNNLLEISIALHIFKLRNGRYPDNLTQLSPVYCKESLIDPFTINGYFRYKKTSQKYLLYSVGPDGKDNNGLAIAGKNKYGELNITSGSIGDIMSDAVAM